MNILVSACLFGVNCKYSGENNYVEKIHGLKDNHTLILVCPEQLGGLDTPRSPAEIQIHNGSLTVRTKEGTDVTDEFVKGAELTLKIANAHECKLAILKANSPSCGARQIYDGSFSGKLVEGVGITADLLMKNGIAVVSEHDNVRDVIAATEQ